MPMLIIIYLRFKIMGLIIYIIGYFVSYFIIKKYLAKDHEDEWEDVLIRILASLFSWFFVLLIIITTYKYYKHKLPKPPKWL